MGARSRLRGEPIRRRALWLAVAVLAARSSAAAFEVRLWPLFEAKSAAARSEWHLFGPIVEWRRDDDGSRFALRPLLETFHSADAARSRGSLLYPVAWWDRSPNDFFFRALGLFTFRRASAPEPDAYTTNVTLFPFVFFRSGPGVPTSFAVLPLYANLEDFFGYDRIRMLLFPFYLKLTEPLDERTWVPFPFYSWVGGRAGSGWRLWPVYGHTRIGDELDVRYVGWPVNVRSVQHPGRPEEVRVRIAWPLFSTLSGPRVDSWTYGYLLVIPLYTHTIDRATDTETYGYPWPAWMSQFDRKTGERTALRLTPFYEDSRTPATRSTFYLWPFYRHKSGLGDVAPYERTDVLFVLYRDQSEGEGAGRERIFSLVPLWTSHEIDGSRTAQAPALFEAIFPKNEPVRRLYAPLYRLYGEATGGSGSEHEILWRMVAWGDGKVRPPWYLSLD